MGNRPERRLVMTERLTRDEAEVVVGSILEAADQIRMLAEKLLEEPFIVGPAKRYSNAVLRKMKESVRAVEGLVRKKNATRVRNLTIEQRHAAKLERARQILRSAGYDVQPIEDWSVRA